MTCQVFFSDLEGWSLKLVLFINYMYLRHMPFLIHEEFNIRKCIHDLSGHVDRFIWVGLWISCYICTDANSLQIQSRFRVLFSKFISNDRWSFSMTHNKHIKRQFLPFISVRQGVGFLLLLLWIMANILRFFRNCFLYIYFFINYSCMGEFVERNVIRSYWMFTGTYDSFHLSLTLFLYNYERYNMARGDGHLDSFYPWSQVLVLLSWTRVSWFEKKILIKKNIQCEIS